MNALILVLSYYCIKTWKKSSNIGVLRVLDFYFDMIIVCIILMVLLNVYRWFKNFRTKVSSLELKHTRELKQIYEHGRN